MSQTNQNGWPTNPWIGETAAAQIGLWQATLNWASLTGWFAEGAAHLDNVKSLTENSDAANSPSIGGSPDAPAPLTSP